MKLTPEQKAFYEYGGAWETTVVIHTFIRSLLKNKGYQLSPELLHHYRDKKSHYGKILREAWKLRRKCRAFMVSNDCSKCIHRLNKSPDGKCGGCKWDISYKIVKSRWEPRKEGES